jgi:hypothetical protein
LLSDILIDNESGTWSDVILLKNIDSTEWVVFWVVDYDTLKLSQNADYSIYWNKTLWYRKLDTSEITSLEATSTGVYDLTFFPDKLYSWLKIKDFQTDFYNLGAIIDIKMDILLYYNETNDWILLNSVNPSDIININLNF